MVAATAVATVVMVVVLGSMVVAVVAAVGMVADGAAEAGVEVMDGAEASMEDLDIHTIAHGGTLIAGINCLKN